MSSEIGFCKINELIEKIEKIDTDQILLIADFRKLKLNHILLTCFAALFYPLLGIVILVKLLLAKTPSSIVVIPIGILILDKSQTLKALIPI